MSATGSQTRYPQVGGHHAFDLVDTVHWRLDPERSIDTLPSFDAVLVWCGQTGVLDDEQRRSAAAAATADPAGADREHRAVIALREAVYRAVFEDDDAAVALVAREHASALAGSTLVRDGDRGWTWQPPGGLTAARTAVAALAEDLLTSDLTAARQCADDACGWVYLDTSPRHNRQWCTSAGCGNRNRVARHHARKRQQG